MKTVIAYTDNGGLVYVKLDKDIVLIEAEKLCSNEAKLASVLQKQKERDSAVMGVVVSENLLIRLKDDMRFEGIIWSNRKRLSGKYEYL